MKVSAIAIVGFFSVAVGSAFAQGVTDAQIAAIVVTANQVDIDAGKLGQARSQDDAVKRFAQMMVTSHTTVNKSAVDLVTRLEVTPKDNATDTVLIPGATNAELKALLVKVRPAFAAHLEHAKRVQTSITSLALSSAKR